MKAPVSVMLDILCTYYAPPGEKERPMNPVQTLMYREALDRFPLPALEAAARAWIRKSRFFPGVSDLLQILETPDLDPAVAAQLAWTTFERAIQHAGAYRGVTFENGAIGETVRQVFGNWPTACSFDLDSAGWTIRRQSFLAIFPTVMRQPHGPVTLVGRHKDAKPHVVAAIAGLPSAPALTEAEDRNRPATREEAKIAMDRFHAQRKALNPGGTE